MRDVLLAMLIGFAVIAGILWMAFGSELLARDEPVRGKEELRLIVVVTDAASGEPLEGARVLLRTRASGDAPGSDAEVARAETDASGEATVTGFVTTGGVSLVVAKPGRETRIVHATELWIEAKRAGSSLRLPVALE